MLTCLRKTQKTERVEAFEAYCDAHNLKKGNMKELLGIFARGREGTAATFKYGHGQLSSVEWVAHSQSNDSIPLLGSPQDMFKTLQNEHAMTLASSTVKDFLNGKNED